MELTEAELQAKIDAALKAATDGLVAKNKELLGKLDKHKSDQEAADKLAADKAEQERQDKLTAEGKHEEVLNSVKTTMQATIDTLTEKLDGAVATATKATGDLRKLLVDQGLSNAFLEAGVTDKNLLLAAVSMEIGKAEIVDDEDGNPVVKMAGMDMDTFITDWSNNVGKSFIANGNSGGGAGGPGGGGGTDDWESYFKPETINRTKQLELQRTDPERFSALDKKYNAKSHLPLSAGGRS